MTVHQILSLIKLNSVLDSSPLFAGVSIINHLHKEGLFVVELGRYWITTEGLQALRTLESQGIHSELIPHTVDMDCDLPFNCHTAGVTYA